MTNLETESSVSIRPVEVSDAQALDTLLRELNYPASPVEIENRVSRMTSDSDVLLVAERDNQIQGLLTMHMTPVIHRPNPVARITLLVVSSRSHGQGIGRVLVEAAERESRLRGCTIIEVISNKRYADAHDFYEHLGYKLTSYKFKKLL